MQTLIAVIKDLWEFTFGNSIVTEGVAPKSVEQTALLSPQVVPLSLPAAVSSPVLAAPVPASGLLGEKAYVVLPDVRIHARPVLSFDGAVQSLSYAESVNVLGYEGRFVHVTHGSVTGWVLKDALALHAEDVFPTFHNGEIYSLNHPDTKKLRDITHDEFLAGELCLALQSVEFVLYRLSQLSRKIDWSTTRPRLAGNWQNILKGKLGIQIGVRPKTGAIIEYTKSDGTGFVGYIKAVHIDEAIVMEGVGRLIEGEYREELIPKEEWQELRPIFIQVQ